MNSEASQTVAIPSIVLWPDPVLKEVAKPIKEFDWALGELVESMFLTCEANKGLGLAAPQLGEPFQIFVTVVDGDRRAYVNPHVAPSGEWERQVEGCLSVPGFSGKVNRRNKAVITAFDIHGGPIREEATGILARTWQHEYDHLKGIMFFDHLKINQRNDLLFRFARRDDE